jgi:hypothetical protein
LLGLLSLLISLGGCPFLDFMGTLFVVGVLIRGLGFQLKRLLGSGSFLSSLWLLGLCSRMCFHSFARSLISLSHMLDIILNVFVCVGWRISITGY